MHINRFEISCSNKFAPIKIGNYLSNYITKNTAIICIGTDRCIVDCLGPLVGTMLENKKVKIKVYGSLKEPIHAVNFLRKIEIIKSWGYTNLIAVDACLSERKRQGLIEIKEGAISPGKGIGKILPKVGDLSIIGIIDHSGIEFQQLLQETRLSFVYEMAETIAEGIKIASNMINDVELKTIEI